MSVQARLALIWQAIQQSLTQPSLNLRQSGVVIGGIAVLVLLLVAVLALAFTPSRRKVVRRVRRRVRRPGEAPAKSARPAAAKASAKPAQPSSPRPPSAFGRAMTVAAPWMIGALVVLAAGSGYAVSKTNTYCLLCHNGDPGVAKTALFRHASCTQCHERPGIDGAVQSVSDQARMMVAEVARTQPSALSVSDTSDSCLRCHREITSGTVTSSLGVRMSHKEPLADGMDCSACHAASHGKVTLVATMSTCVVCHDGKKASSSCAVCHVRAPGTLSAENTQTIGSGNYAYTTVPILRDDCLGCHDVAKECDSCHGLRMPHSPEFIAGGHAREAGFYKKSVCWKCHDQSMCRQCHGDFNSGHPGNWLQIHRNNPSDAYCICHARMSGRTTSMCLLCHDKSQIPPPPNRNETATVPAVQ